MGGYFNWADVEVRGECIPWKGVKDAAGYGVFKWYERGGYSGPRRSTRKSKGDPYVKGKRKSMGAHRKAWIDAYGPIPQKRHIMHLCNNRACVNPDHLRCGTAQDNSDHAFFTGARKRNGEQPIEWVLRTTLK